MENVQRSIEAVCNPDAPQQVPRLESLISAMITLAVVFGYPQLSLQAAQPIVSMLLDQRGSEAVRQEITSHLGAALARIRLYHRDRVDNFLEDQNAPENLRHVVRTTIVQEDIWGDFLAARWGGFSLKIIHIPVVRGVIWEILNASTHYHTLESWLNFCLRRITNFVYGSDIFPIQKKP